VANEAKRHDASSTLSKMTSKVAVVGAGQMGASIAVALASAGLAVKLKDIDEAALAKGMQNIEEILKKMVNKGLSEEEAASRRLYSSGIIFCRSRQC